MVKWIGRALAAAAVLLVVDAARSAAPPALDPKALAGVYKRQFENGDVSGRKYASEDILEIVPTGPDAAYFREHLEFFNGHICAINGIAHRAGDELIYRSREPPPAYAGAPACVMHIRREGQTVFAGDMDGGCAAYCGARGSLKNSAFPLKARRPIRYAARLRASRQFRAALAEDAGS